MTIKLLRRIWFMRFFGLAKVGEKGGGGGGGGGGGEIKAEKGERRERGHCL